VGPNTGPLSSGAITQRHFLVGLSQGHFLVGPTQGLLDIVTQRHVILGGETHLQRTASPREMCCSVVLEEGVADKGCPEDMDVLSLLLADRLKIGLQTEQEIELINKTLISCQYI